MSFRFLPLFVAVSMSLGCSVPSADSQSKALADQAIAAAPTGKWYWIGTLAADDRLEVADPGRYSLEFQTDGVVLVQADCNQGRSRYALAQGEVQIQAPGMTKIGCGSASHDREFLHQLTQPGRWTASGSLAVFGTNARQMHFARDPKARLPTP